jgi:hypothetical protein
MNAFVEREIHVEKNILRPNNINGRGNKGGMYEEKEITYSV